MTQGLSELGMLRLENGRLRGCHQSVKKYLKENAKRTEPGSFQWCPMRQWAQTETWEVPSEQQETLSYCEGDQIGSQQGHGLSLGRCKKTQEMVQANLL